MSEPTMYSDADEERVYPHQGSGQNPWRSNWRRDYARVIHCPAFRRLQGKTQLFYGSEVDGVRNRLTHSLEVAQIAKSIAEYINYSFEDFQPDKYQINPNICEIAALVHDMGHPPFGHNGEKALDDCALAHGGFEGNAQTLRILAKLEKRQTLDDTSRGITEAGKDVRAGLNLTYRVLASCLKYDKQIPETRKKKGVIKGYYAAEAELVTMIKERVAGISYDDKFKAVECSIMDIADDIAYSTYDLEDAFKSGFLNPLDLINPSKAKVSRIWDAISNEDKVEFAMEDIREVLFSALTTMFRPAQLDNAPELNIREMQNPEGFADWLISRSGLTYNDAIDLASNGYRRSRFTSALVNQHLQGVKVDFNDDIPALSKVYLEKDTRFMVEVLKKFTYVSVIESPRLKIPEFRGYEVVKTIFEAISDEHKEGFKLLPDDYREMYDRLALKPDERVRLIVDFVAGMTDRYAIDFYNRLVSDVPQTIYGPL